MPSKIAICNAALALVGDNRINSLLEDSEGARQCAAWWDIARDAVLASHPWNFAMKRVSLARLSDAPTFDYDYAFQLPSDCLRVWETDDDDYPYKIEGRTLLSDRESVKILYIARIEDTTYYSPVFVEALALHLAWNICYRLKSSRSHAEFLYQQFEATMQRARSVDAQEGSADELSADEWLDSRL